MTEHGKIHHPIGIRCHPTLGNSITMSTLCARITVTISGSCLAVPPTGGCIAMPTIG